MNSSRFPGKALKKISSKPILQILIENVIRSKFLSKVNLIVATTKHSEDDEICNLCDILGVNYHRGSDTNVLSRLYDIIIQKNPDYVIRITGDNPLTSHEIIDKYVNFAYENKNYDYIYDGEKKHPLGMSAEVFKASSFLNFTKNIIVSESTKEHISPIFTKNKKSCNLLYDYHKDCSFIRLTVDTQEDFDLVNKIIEIIGKFNIPVSEIIDFISQNEELLLINKHIKQIKRWK